MGKKKSRPGSSEPYDSGPPSWVVDEHLDRTTPYTEEELDLLVEGSWEGIRSTPAWKNRVREVGEEEARRIIRAALIMRYHYVMKLPTH